MICACGCPLPVIDRAPDAIYATPECAKRAQNRRRRVSRLTALEGGDVQLPAMKPTAHRVLKALIAVGGNGATTRELAQPDVGGLRFGGRVHELRPMGFRIDARRERNGSTRYWLRDSPLSTRLFDVERRAA